MSVERYPVGSEPIFTFTFALAGVKTDPAAPVFIVQDPSLAETVVLATDPAVTHVGTGVYDVKVLLAAKGRWRVRGKGTAAGRPAAEHTVMADTDFRAP